jgi:hypothetical protein
MTTGDTPLLALTCLFSASGFAASNALQHRVAGTVPADVAHHAIGVLAQVVRRPLWLLATTISFAALLLHATALKLGPIALVQPLMLVGVVIAVPVRAALDLTTPTWRELRAVLITVAGLAMFMWGVNPARPTTGPSPVPAALMVFVGVGTAVVVLVTSKRLTGRPNRQASILGATAGVMFGLTAGLLKLIGSALSSEHPAAAAVPLAALIGAGVLGVAMNQRAYQIAPLSVSMPLLNVLDVLVAVTFGVLVFHEAPGHGPTVLALQCIALGCLAVGLREVARLGTRPTPSEPVTARGRCAS